MQPAAAPDVVRFDAVCSLAGLTELGTFPPSAVVGIARVGTLIYRLSRVPRRLVGILASTSFHPPLLPQLGEGGSRPVQLAAAPGAVRFDAVCSLAGLAELGTCPPSAVVGIARVGTPIYRLSGVPRRLVGNFG